MSLIPWDVLISLHERIPHVLDAPSEDFALVARRVKTLYGAASKSQSTKLLTHNTYWYTPKARPAPSTERAYQLTAGQDAPGSCTAGPMDAVEIVRHTASTSTRTINGVSLGHEGHGGTRTNIGPTVEEPSVGSIVDGAGTRTGIVSTAAGGRGCTITASTSLVDEGSIGTTKQKVGREEISTIEEASIGSEALLMKLPFVLLEDILLELEQLAVTLEDE